MRREFIQYPGFAALVKSGDMSDKTLRAIEHDIMAGKGVVMQGTGGLKKLRGKRERSGKRGGWRVIFADYPKLGITIFVEAFNKPLKETLTNEEKKYLAGLKREMDMEVKRYVKKTKIQE